MSGEIDATVWNLDEVKDRMAKINYRKISEMHDSDTNAVMIVNGTREEMVSILKKMVSVDDVLTTQKMVENGTLTPSY